MQYCDLHTHSNHSDGTYTPAELISEAEAIGLSAVALNDHNTVSGLPEFLKAAEGRQITAVAGVELSTDYGETELHILGLFLPPESFEAVDDFVSVLVKNKENSNRQLINNLKNAGYDIDFDEIKAKTANGRFNRSHIGEALTEKGYVESISKAFETLLAKDSEFYVPVKRVNVFDAIRFIKSIGAVAVLAHPFLDLNEDELLAFLPKARDCGLDAIESLYLNFDTSATERLCAIADDFSLLYSGGSDFHGSRKPGITLGTGSSGRRIPASVYERLTKI